MTPKQVAYIRNRIDGQRPREAAIAAGYAPTGAAQAAAMMEKRADVQKAIKKKVVPPVNEALAAGGVQRGAAELAKDAAADPDNWMRDYYETPLDLLKHVMNEPRAAKGLRFEAAKIAAPYMHGKAEPENKGKGKKAQAEEVAKQKAKTGKFQRRAAPGTRRMTLN